MGFGNARGPGDGGKMHLLVVDAERMFGEALAIFLDGQDDIDVVGTALRLTQAVAMTSALHPDIVTTGYKLPDGDGVDLVRQLRSQTPDVKTLMVSAFEQEAVVLAAMEAGCSGFVSKGLPLADVATAARAVMRGETVIPRELLGRVVEYSLEGTGWQGTNLTPTEHEILKLFPEGLPDRAIAERLGLSERSIRNHIQSILPKLESHSKLQALATAIQRGILILALS
jgi:DNA-binding NarL/FixJ family response regulator